MNASIDIIEQLFGSPGRVAILRLLARSTVPLTGRQVAELAGLTPAGASRALDRLTALGVVSRRRVGRAQVHELQRESLMARTIVLPVFSAEADLLPRLENDLAEDFGGQALSVVLFGSVARGEAGPGSDIDVLVVMEDRSRAEQVEEIAAEEGPRYFRTYGMPLSVISKSRSEMADAPAFAQEAIREGVTVSGVPVAEVVQG